MNAAVLSPQPSALPPELLRRPLSVDDVLRMVEAGVLDEDERVELIEGELIAMAPIGGAHMQAVNWLNQTLVLAASGQAVVSVQNNIALRPRSLPQPDLVLLPAALLKRREVPGPEDVLLAIEVADSTFAKDRNVKAPLYARHGIAEYWIVDVTQQRVLVHRVPRDGAYAQCTEHRAGERIAPQALPRVVVDLGALFS